MTTVHHPSHMGFRYAGHERLWLGISVLLVALVTFAVLWIMNRPETTATPSLESTSGFVYDHEVTAGHIAGPGVTTDYLGNSGELYPAISVLPAATGFAYDHEVTASHLASPGVTTQYLGYSGELYPDR